MPLAAGIAAGASLLGNIFGASNTNKTNQANKEIAQMNNEFNAREAQKAFDRETAYNDKIRAEDMAYNSAKAQVERYREAGLNPSIMMQGQSAVGQSSSGVSSSAASSVGNPTMQAFHPDFSGVQNAAMFMADMQMKREMQDEQLKGMRIENQYKMQEILARIDNMYKDSKDKEARAKLNETINSYQDQIQADQHNLAYQQARSYENNAQLAYAQRLLVNKELATFDENFRTQVAMRLSQIELQAAQTGLHRQLKRTEVYNTLKAAYEAQGTKDAVRMAQRQTDKILKQMDADLEWTETQTKYYPYSVGASGVNSAINLILGGAAAYGMVKGWRPPKVVRGFK